MRGALSWVDCPICGGTDMRREEQEDGSGLIQCVNTSCPSNQRPSEAQAAPEPPKPAHPLAFPHVLPEGFVYAEGGMTLWDHYAGRAMTGLLQIPHPDRADESAYAGFPEMLAGDCFDFADAMMAERARRLA